MTSEEMRKIYGEEYPAAVICDGIRLPLARERRFSRSYGSKEHKLQCGISRFMDGSVSITASDLRMEWHSWTSDERSDFCQNCDWLSGQKDFSDMLRFIMEHGSEGEWSAIALSVASKLPCNEAFDLLVRALRTVEIGRSANLGQAIARVKHPEAEKILREHLQGIGKHPGLWDDDEFLNWVAFDALTCIAHLIEAGARKEDFEDQVKQLAEHPCAGNQQSCRNYLSRHYVWLTRN